MRKPRSLTLALSATVSVALAHWGCAKPETPAPAPAPAAAPAAPVAPADPVCKDGSRSDHPDGKLKECLLAQDWAAGPYTCRMNWSLVLHPNGALKECKISGTATFDGLAVKESLALYEDGKLKRGIVAAAKTFGDVEAREGDWVTLYPGGALNRLELSAGPRTIQGYPCRGSENYFHENGKLKKCTLGEVFKQGEKEIPAGTLLCFDETGAPKEPCGLMTP
jgi:hypothetical protein